MGCPEMTKQESPLRINGTPHLASLPQNSIKMNQISSGEFKALYIMHVHVFVYTYGYMYSIDVDVVVVIIIIIIIISQ